MKRTFILMALALTIISANAQTIQTKTEKINKTTTRTYSYYVNEQGEEIRHGKYRIVWKENRNDYKVNKILNCNYKDGLLHGRLTYSCDWNVYEAYLSLLGKEDVVWKLVQKNLDNFSVDMYEGYMTGDINVTYQGWWSNETTFKAKAINGVLADDSELVITEQSRQLVQEKLRYIGESSEVKRYKNVLPANTPNANLQEPSEFIAFDFPSDNNGGMERYIVNLPRYVEKPFDELKDIPEYQFMMQYQGTNLNEILYIEDNIVNSYYLSQIDKDTLHSHYIKAKEQVRERQEKEQEIIRKREKTYSSAYSQAENIVKKYKRARFYLKPMENYYTMDGIVHPVVLNEAVDSLLFGMFNKHLNVIEETINSLEFHKYDYSGKGDEDLTDETVKTMSDYLQRLNDTNVTNAIEQLEILCEQLNKNMNKIYHISSGYTKSTYNEGRLSVSSSKSPRFTNKNCTTKCNKKKDLYNAYVEVADNLYNKLKTSTIDEYQEGVKQFISVIDVMYEGLDSNTKDLEKALKSASTPEEKLNLFLQTTIETFDTFFGTKKKITKK